MQVAKQDDEAIYAPGIVWHIQSEMRVNLHQSVDQLADKIAPKCAKKLDQRERKRLRLRIARHCEIAHAAGFLKRTEEQLPNSNITLYKYAKV